MTCKLIQMIFERDEPFHFSFDRDAQIESDRVENAQAVGFILGGVQDIACVVGSVAYLSGSNSRLAATAAAITGGKLAINAPSAGGYLLYRSITRNRNPQPLLTDLNN